MAARHPTNTATRISNRLVDLHLLAEEDGRALVELRRLIELYPGTDTSIRAREALGRLKSAQAS